MRINPVPIPSRPTARTGLPPRVRVRKAGLVCAAALLAGACSDPVRTEPMPPAGQGRDFVRLQMSAPAPATWEVAGPVVVSGDEPDPARSWASLRSGLVTGSVLLSHIVDGNRVDAGAYPPGTFTWFVNPTIDRLGVYHPGDCPRFTPTFQDCVRMRLSLHSVGGSVEAVIDAIPDSVIVFVTEYGDDHIRASFTGRFNYAPATGAATHIDAKGEVEVARFGSR